MVSESLVCMLTAQPDMAITGVAATAAAAREEVTAHEPDVVVLDQNLPDGTGVEVAFWLAECHPQVKVLLLSGWPDESVLSAAVEAGCAGYVQKASAFSDLVAAVRAVDAGEIVFPPDLLMQAVARLRRSGGKGAGELSERELEILRLVADGHTNRVIAERLHLSVNTIRNHVQVILSKLGGHSKLDAVMIAQRKGLLRRR